MPDDVVPGHIHRALSLLEPCIAGHLEAVLKHFRDGCEFAEEEFDLGPLQAVGDILRGRFGTLAEMVPRLGNSRAINTGCL